MKVISLKTYTPLEQKELEWYQPEFWIPSSLCNILPVVEDEDLKLLYAGDLGMSYPVQLFPLYSMVVSKDVCEDLS